MRMQIAFRETTTERNGYQVVIAGGLIDIDPEDGIECDEQLLSFDMVNDENGQLSGAFVRATPRPIVYEEELLAQDTLEHLLTCRIPRMNPSEFANAEFALRKTYVEPGDPQGVVYGFSGFYYLEKGASLDFAKAYQLETVPGLDGLMKRTGILGQDWRPELGEVDVVMEMRGEAMAALLKKPWWGFGEEPVSLPGTMRREIYDQLDRLHRLHFVEGDRSSDEYRGLVDAMREVGLASFLRDKGYERYLTARYADPSIETGFRPMPISRMATREQAVGVIVKSLLEEPNSVL